MAQIERIESTTVEPSGELSIRPALLAKVDRLEQALLEYPQADIETLHSFSPGQYSRKIIIPPWTVLTGAEHRTDYTVRLEAGRIAVNVDGQIRVLTAPLEFRAPAGVKRAGFVLSEPVVWVDVYDNPDDCRDIATLENRLYVIPACGLGENRVAAEIERDRADYALFLQEFGFTQAELDPIVCNTTDMIELPGEQPVELRPSKIHGVGLFALRDFAAGERICAGRLNGKRTIAGRYINHSAMPNVHGVRDGDDIYAVAACQIRENAELLVDYRDSMRVNFGLLGRT